MLGQVQRLGIVLRVRHLCGWGDPEAVARSYAAEGVEAEVEGFVPNLSEAYRETAFALTTAGAFTLAELAAWRIPALLVPLDGAAGRHQHANADVFARQTGALRIWRPEAVAELLKTPERLGQAAERMAAGARPHAARELAAACLEPLLGGSTD